MESDRLRARASVVSGVMKRRVLIGALAWALLISLAHVSVNIGWATLKGEVDVLRGVKRRELIVGFLPVT